MGMGSEIIKTKDRVEDAYKTLERNIAWINHADNKASILLAVVAILFGSTLFLNEITSFIVNQNNQIYIRIIVSLTAITYGLVILLSIVYLFLVIKARVNNDLVKSHLFFGDIANMSIEELKSRYKKMTTEDLLDSVLEQVFMTSQIANIKFKYLNVTYILLTVGILLAIFLSVFINLF